MESENSIRENRPTPDAGNETKKQTIHSEIPIPVTFAPEPERQPPHCHYEITRKAEKDWWDKSKRWVEIAGLILLGVYTAYTIKMYHANKKSADAATSAANTAEE